MARLNEPPAPTESIEALKRRFLRQNRDIARANSTQSLRIRNLENETSRLLAENLDLREHIIQLQNELENGKAQRIVNNTDAIKSQLQAKLLEVGELLTSLGEEQAQKKRSPRKGNVTRASPSKSPDQRRWKNMCTLSEAVAGQEGRLPLIVEENDYLRTLECQELADLIADAAVDTTDSPEIGPPPVSQFVDEDPVKIDLPTRPKRNEHEDLSELDPALSVNLEQRRKRRDSSSSSEGRRSSKVELPPATTESTASLKAGAKRKLSIRDDEEPGVVIKEAETSLDEFKFTRVASDDKTRQKQTSQPERSGSKVARELAIARGAPRDKQPPTAAPTSRKVLAPKSVNSSPKKGARTPIHDELKAAKADILKANSIKERQRDRRQEHVSIKTPVMDFPLETVEVPSEPETPAGLDLFSPSSSQPSTARNESQDTPPPPDLGPGTEGQRPSRRARAAVSYAEPSLRDKMRRPTKELIDAVVPGLNQSHRTGTIKIEGVDPATSMRIKSELEAHDAWKRMPVASTETVENSPLSGKTSASEPLPSSITTHRKRRESILAEADLPRTSSASAMAALLAGNRRLRAETQDRKLEGQSASSKASMAHDIYDFRGSSPIPAEDPAIKPAKEEQPVSRFSRRHSSVQRDIPPVYDSESSDPEGTRKGDLSKTRRRQSSLGLRSSSSASMASSKEEDMEKKLKKASSTIAQSDSGSGAARSDRVSARRRSMML